MATRYKAVARRLAQLEQAAADATTAWLRGLTDDELNALCNAIPPDERAAFDALTDDELERLAAGYMSKAEWQRRLHRARRTNGT